MSDRGMAILEAAKMAPKKSEPVGDEPDADDETEVGEGELSAAEDVMAAFESKDPAAVAKSLRTFFEML